MSDTKKMTIKPPFVNKIALLLSAALLVSGCSDEAQQADATARCNDSVKLASTIRPLIGGEIAGFAVLDEPKPMSLLKFKDEKGQDADITAFKGKTVLLNLWATWCAPCRKEMPAFDRLQGEFGGEVFTVLPISIDRGGIEKPKGFFKEINVQNLPLYQDETMGVFNTLKKQSLAYGLPTTILIDKQGCVIGSLNGPAEWDGKDAKKLVGAALGKSS